MCVTLLQQKKAREVSLASFCDNLLENYRAAVRKLFRELRDPVRKPRDSAAGIILMDDAELCGAHDGRLGALHRVGCLAAVAGSYRFLNVAHRIFQRSSARFVDFRLARGLPGGLTGRFGIRHYTLGSKIDAERSIRQVNGRLL